MCAHCHVADFRKNYDAATDTYASTWLEDGVGSVQCHGGITQQHLAPGYAVANLNRQPIHQDPHRVMETCAPCQVRNGLLAGALVPGGRYADYYRITLPVQPVFSPKPQRDGTKLTVVKPGEAKPFASHFVSGAPAARFIWERLLRNRRQRVHLFPVHAGNAFRPLA
jgi:hypothetical protein